VIDKQALMRIAAESLCDLRTVTKAYAAEALRLPMPPEPTSKVPGFGGEL
jgi:hypothetical protein